MILNHQYKFIYIKHTKVAGTSTETLLEQYCKSPDDIVTPRYRHDGKGNVLMHTFNHTPRNYGPKYNLPCTDHVSPKELLDSTIPDDIIQRYTKLFTVRNPYDRCVSMYHHHMWCNQVNITFEEYLEQPPAVLFIPYTDWFISGKPFADYIIRYENLVEDTFTFLTDLGLNTKGLNYPTDKKEYSQSRKPYRDYYNNKTKSIVESRYADDINYFNYKF